MAQPSTGIALRRRYRGRAMFDDASTVRRVNGEAALLLGGGRALLMQIAHPQVAAGVADHSSFEGDRVRRLLRTLRPTYAIVFGGERQAQRAAARIRARHARVTGAGYAANDPALLLWVHATLVDTALHTYQRFVRRLSVAERERYYGEMARIGELLGVPRETMPPDLGSFTRYVDCMVETLEVSETARRLANAILRLRPLYAAPLLLTVRELTAGLPPPPLRTQYALPWDARRESLLRGAASLSRSIIPRLPARLRRPPPPLMPALEASHRGVGGVPGGACCNSHAGQ